MSRPALLLGGATGALVLLLLFDPASAGFYPPCPFRLVTGWQCPGCGTLRASHRLLHGDLRGAWRLNPVAVLALPALLYVSLSLLLGRLGHRLPVPRVPASVWIALSAGVLTWGVARNL